MPARRLFLIRHGETEGESSIRYHGITDTPLSARGRLQMQRVAARLHGQAIDTWVASPLRRSWRGAFIASRGVWVRIEPGLREVDFGRWEGLTAEEIRARDPELFARWRSVSPGPGFDYPDGEASEAFERRITAATDRILAEAGPCAALVLHKGVIRRVMARLGAEVPDRERPELGEMIPLAFGPDGWARARYRRTD